MSRSGTPLINPAVQNVLRKAEPRLMVPPVLDSGSARWCARRSPL
jgi:hypothetical protein